MARIEVTVDVDTGHIRVDRVTSTHDVVGDQPALVRGRSRGLSFGYAMSEDLQLADGFITNPGSRGI